MRTFTIISAILAGLSAIEGLYQLVQKEFPVIVQWSKAETAVCKVFLNTCLAIFLVWLAYR